MSASAATKATRFLQSLWVPEGPLVGQKLKLAPFQRQFVKGALAPDISVAALSVGRGNAKTALASGLALGALLGVWDKQPRREIPICARTRDQARIAWNFVCAFVRCLPEDLQKRISVRRQPRYEIEFEDENGPHIIRAIAADGKSALGMAPAPLALLDERGHWMRDQGDELEAAILSALGKRGGKALIISTSAPDDTHPFSKWLDEPQPGVYRQEHRPTPGLPADDVPSLLLANPGCKHGIGSSQEWLTIAARRAVARGGSSLASFRLLNRNERVSDDTRSVLITTDQWLWCETETLPPREGPLVVGIDLGGSMSMSAWASFWPSTGRLEVYGAFAGTPGLQERGEGDGVGSRYVEMRDRGELITLGANVVPVDQFIGAMLAKLEGYPIATICCDRFRQSEFLEALAKTSMRIVPTWRGQGWKDSGEDCERFRQFVFDRKIKSKVSLLLRSAFADAVTLIDPAGTAKIAKGRSLGRIDAAAASVLAVAEGARQSARPVRKARAPQWA
jgi:phage terminase large subunit-like protein